MAWRSCQNLRTCFFFWWEVLCLLLPHCPWPCLDLQRAALLLLYMEENGKKQSIYYSCITSKNVPSLPVPVGKDGAMITITQTGHTLDTTWTVKAQTQNLDPRRSQTNLTSFKRKIQCDDEDPQVYIFSTHNVAILLSSVSLKQGIPLLTSHC